MTSTAVAQREYARVMATTGAARIQGLVKLARVYPEFAPVWAALAEEHWAARRREEALQATRRAFKLDPSLHSGLSRELKMASRSILAQVEPERESASHAAARAAGASSTGPRWLSSTARVNPQMLSTALSLRDPDERIALLQDLETITPEDPDVLFHLAKELAISSRADAARDVGERLNRCAPERYVELYTWAENNLARAQAQRSSNRAAVQPTVSPGPASSSRQSPPRPKSPQSPRTQAAPSPRQPSSTARQPSTTARAGQPSSMARQPSSTAGQPSTTARQPSSTAGQPSTTARERQPSSGQPSSTARQPSTTARARQAPVPQRPAAAPRVPQQVFDDAATLDAALNVEPSSSSSSSSWTDDEEVTARSTIDDLRPKAMIGDGDSETARLPLAELERLVAVSMDPDHDS